MHFVLSVRSAYVLKLTLYFIFTDIIRVNSVTIIRKLVMPVTHPHRGRKLKTEE